VLFRSAASFVLIGTMNPEEGELRPQLLDRFGLTVEVAAPRDPAVRAEVVRRRIAFDSDPAGFTRRYRAADEALTGRIEDARERVAKVRLTEAALLKIAEVCAAFEVDGLRADIVTARAAVAHAAWEGRDEVTRADIRRAALLALPHRRRRNPFDAPGLDEALLDQILGDEELPPEPPEGPAPDDPPNSSDAPAEEEPADTGPDDTGLDGSDPADPEASAATPPPSGSAADSTVAAATPYRPRLLTARGRGEGAAGRRSRAIASTGRRIGARRPEGAGGSLHLVETLLQVVGRRVHVLAHLNNKLKL
jgi:magnesium chelatase subunit D